MTLVSTEPLPLIDLCPETDTFLDEVLDGLRQTPKRLSPKFFYDARGSQLFDHICRLDEYYLTRTEMAIMRQSIDEIVAHLGRQCLLLEYGSGSSLKTRILLDHLDDPAGYVPIDISREHLLQSATELAATYPDLRVIPVCADYTTPLDLPNVEAARTVVYFPGSTIGNFEQDDALAFLQRIAAVCGSGGGLLIGVDLKKDADAIKAAYNDRQGITAAFNKNVLRRINRELDGTFAIDQFAHRAFFNDDHGRIEMHLVSCADQQVSIADAVISFRAGETILTEYSYKYSLDDFARLAAKAGFSVRQVWTDERDYFSVQYLVAD